ncbi:hypothetical protein DBR06_SOUSAS7010025, partial [Sousa chinensis]
MMVVSMVQRSSEKQQDTWWAWVKLLQAELLKMEYQMWPSWKPVEVFMKNRWLVLPPHPDHHQHVGHTEAAYGGHDHRAVREGGKELSGLADVHGIGHDQERASTEGEVVAEAGPQRGGKVGGNRKYWHAESSVPSTCFKLVTFPRKQLKKLAQWWDYLEQPLVGGEL